MIDAYEIICRHVTVPLWAKYEKSKYLNYLKEQKEFQYLDRDSIAHYQLNSAKRIVSHAYKNCKFYRDFYSKNGIHPGDIRTWGDFHNLPVLSKELVRQNMNGMIAGNFKREKLVPGKTSGSSGKPLDFFIDEDCTQKQRSCALLTNEWAGYKIGRKIFSMFGQSALPEKKRKLRGYLRNKLLNRSINLSTLNLTESTMLTFYRELIKVSKPFLHGYAHALFLFTRFLQDNGLNDCRAVGIISGGMTLSEWQRKKIEDVFGCKVINRYGCEELGTIASECDRQEGLHINSYSKIVEVVDQSGQLEKCGRTGSLIVTELNNYGMPFIRYMIEDKGRYSDKLCSCGRTLPLLSSIDGRESDFIVTPDGRLVSGISLTDNFGANIPGIVQVQLFQEKADRIDIRIVKDSHFTQDSFKIIYNLSERYFGKDMNINCIFVKNIPPEASGKYRFVLSKIAVKL